MLSLAWSEARIIEVIEKFNLDVALKSFMSNNLEKKLKGIKFIRNIVARYQIMQIVSYFKS